MHDATQNEQLNRSVLRWKKKKKTSRNISHSTSSPCMSVTSVLPKPRRYECVIILGCTNYPSLSNHGFARWQLCSGFVAVQRPSSQTAFVKLTQEEKGWFSNAIMRPKKRNETLCSSPPTNNHSATAVTFFLVRTFENFPGFAAATLEQSPWRDAFINLELNYHIICKNFSSGIYQHPVRGTGRQGHI